MKNVTDAYLDLIQPLNLNAYYKRDEDFWGWCMLGTIEDLECTLEAFVEAELYERCCIIRDVIKVKTDAKE